MKRNKSYTNEMKVLRAFMREFNPFYEYEADTMSYQDLVTIVKLTVKEM